MNVIIKQMLYAEKKRDVRIKNQKTILTNDESKKYQKRGISFYLFAFLMPSKNVGIYTFEGFGGWGLHINLPVKKGQK